MLSLFVHLLVSFCVLAKCYDLVTHRAFRTEVWVDGEHKNFDTGDQGTHPASHECWVQTTESVNDLKVCSFNKFGEMQSGTLLRLR